MKQHSLGGQIGTDPNFSHTTHTGHSQAGARHTDTQPNTYLLTNRHHVGDSHSVTFAHAITILYL